MDKLHLVTGYMGEEHIQSADQGSFNASFFGSGEFVMEAGNQFEASIMDNNTVRILDGDVLMKGRHLRIEPKTYADVTIETGTAGVNRNDLIVFQYSKDTATGIESSDIVVIKGTEASGTATDPTYTDGDILGGATFNQMPMYRVKVEGVALTAIEPLFTVIPTYKTLAEQYAQQYADTINKLKTDNILDTMEEVEANTQEGQIAGALSLKEFGTTRNVKTYTSPVQLGLTFDSTLDEIFSAMPQYSQLVTLTPQGKDLGGTLPDTNTATLIVTKGNSERAMASWTKCSSGLAYTNTCYKSAWIGWVKVANQSDLDKKMNKSGGETTGQIQFIRTLGVTAASYSQAGVNMIAPTNENSSTRAGIGFTNQGSNGAYLYLDTDGNFKFINDQGVNKVITPVLKSKSVSGTTSEFGNTPTSHLSSNQIFDKCTLTKPSSNHTLLPTHWGGQKVFSLYNMAQTSREAVANTAYAGTLWYWEFPS